MSKNHSQTCLLLLPYTTALSVCYFNVMKHKQNQIDMYNKGLILFAFFNNEE